MFSRHTGTRSMSWTSTLTNGPTQGRRLTTLTVTLRHNTLTGSRQLLVDGDPVQGSRGRSTVLSASEIAVEVHRKDGGGSVPIVVAVTPDLSSVHLFSYSCLISNAEVKMDTYSIPADPLPSRPSSSSPSSASSASSPPPPLCPHLLSVKFSGEYRIEKHSAADRVALYSIRGVLVSRSDPSQVEATGEQMWLRYSALSEVANVVKSSYKTSRLSSSFPGFPPRCYNPTVDQFGRAFLRERAANLESFWRKLGGMPRVEESVELRRFFGLPVNEGMSV